MKYFNVWFYLYSFELITHMTACLKEGTAKNLCTDPGLAAMFVMYMNTQPITTVQNVFLLNGSGSKLKSKSNCNCKKLAARGSLGLGFIEVVVADPCM